MEPDKENATGAKENAGSCGCARGCGAKGSNKLAIAIWVTFVFVFASLLVYLHAAETKRLLNRAYELYEQRDFVASTECLRQAAERGSAWAQVYYGGHLKDGIGTNPDAVEAVKWFRKSAARNCPEAFLRLGECYEFGEGVDLDLDEAAAWYRKAEDRPGCSERARIALDRIAARQGASPPGSN